MRLPAGNNPAARVKEIQMSDSYPLGNTSDTVDDEAWAANDGTGRYIDWGIKTVDGCQIEIGNENDAAIGFDMTWAEIEALHRALTLRLIRQQRTGA
jgi:hypothetical protein